MKITSQINKQHSARDCAGHSCRTQKMTRQDNSPFSSPAPLPPFAHSLFAFLAPPHFHPLKRGPCILSSDMFLKSTAWPYVNLNVFRVRFFAPLNLRTMPLYKLFYLLICHLPTYLLNFLLF